MRTHTFFSFCVEKPQAEDYFISAWLHQVALFTAQQKQTQIKLNRLLWNQISGVEKISLFAPCTSGHKELWLQPGHWDPGLVPSKKAQTVNYWFGWGCFYMSLFLHLIHAFQLKKKRKEKVFFFFCFVEKHWKFYFLSLPLLVLFYAYQGFILTGRSSCHWHELLYVIPC